MTGWSIDEMAERVARDLRTAGTVNLGIGIPTRVARFMAGGTMVHGENGIIGIGAPPESGSADMDVIDPGKSPVTLVQGASIVDHVTSFTLIRGGRLDVAVLGAYQVSSEGDLANWTTDPSGVGSVGGAMDLAVGARRRWVMMRHTDKSGRPKVVERCSLPITARKCIHRIYTDLAVLDIYDDGLRVVELAPGITAKSLEQQTAARLGWP